MPSGLKQWSCHECGETGLENGHPQARKAFLDHWLECHQHVDF